MAKLTKSDVLHIAKLAKLNLNDVEVEKFLPQLSKVVDFVGQLSEVDTSGVEPTSQTTGLENVTREDIVDTSRVLPQDEYFKVKAILEGRTYK